MNKKTTSSTAYAVSAATHDQESCMGPGQEIDIAQIADEETLRLLDTDWNNKGTAASLEPLTDEKISNSKPNQKIKMPNTLPLTSSKPFPDESNREGIELMLRHAFDFAVESGLIDPVTLEVKEIPETSLPVVTMRIQKREIND